jgi:hypothetical protein
MLVRTVLAFLALVILLLASSCSSVDSSSISGLIATKGPVEGGTAEVAGEGVVISPSGAGPCRVTVWIHISASAAGATSESSGEVVLEVDDQGLHPHDWTATGGGERPAFRRESSTELTIYYPGSVGGRTMWVKFTAVVKPR